MPKMVYPGSEWARLSPTEAGLAAEKLNAAKRWLDDHVGDGRYRVVIVRGGCLVAGWNHGVEREKQLRLASAAKSIFSCILGIAIEEGALSDETLRDLQLRAESLYKHTQFAIMASFGGNVVEHGQELRGWEQFMLDLTDESAFIEDLLGHIVETHLANLALFLEAIGDYVQIIQMGDDLGMQDRLMMSPAMYRRLIKPCHERIYSYVHQHSDCYLFLHSCGSIYPLIPDLIEIGVDILNPVQTSAADMDPQRLKAEFGDQITFWGGGCDTQQVITGATPAEIAAHVAERLRIFAPGGGYVFNQIHNIQADVPPENVVAVYDTARQAGSARQVGGD